jgi:hypothetical protein
MEKSEKKQQQNGPVLESSTYSAIRKYVNSLNELVSCKKKLILEYEKSGASKADFDAAWEDQYWISNPGNCESMMELTFKESILRQRRIRIEKEMQAEIDAIEDEIESLH